MILACPNIRLPEWQSLEKELGERRAYLAFIRNGHDIPTAGKAREILGMKSAEKQLGWSKEIQNHLATLERFERGELHSQPGEVGTFRSQIENEMWAQMQSGGFTPEMEKQWDRLNRLLPEPRQEKPSVVKSNDVTPTQKPVEDTIESVAASYGQTIQDGAMYNRKGNKVADIKISKGRMRFLAPDDGHQMGSIPEGDVKMFERALKENFYAQKTPSLLDYAKSKLPHETADKITSESQVESHRAQWEKDYPRIAPAKPEDKLSGLAKRLLALPAERRVYPMGDENTSLRQDVLEALTGTRPPRAKAGATAVRSALAKHFGVDETKLSQAGVEDEVEAKLRELAGEKPASTTSEKRVDATVFPPKPFIGKKTDAEAGENIFKTFHAKLEAWEKNVGEWLKTKPENKPIIWEQENGNVRALTRNIGNLEKPWRVTSFVPSRDGNALMPWGHQEYETREKAMIEEGGTPARFHDKMPKRVMDEQEIQGYKLMADVPDKSSLAWYKVKPGAQFNSEKIRGSTIMGTFVKDSMTGDGKIAFTSPIPTDDPERLNWLGLEPTDSPESLSINPPKTPEDINPKPVPVDDIGPLKATASDKAVITFGDDKTVRAANPEISLVISAGAKHFTLWLQDNRPGKSRRSDYLTILGQNKEEAIARAKKVADKLAVGDVTGIAFFGKQKWEQPKSIGIFDTPVTSDQLMSRDLTPVGEQVIGFGKMAGTRVKDVWAKDPGWALWAAENMTSGKNAPIGNYLRNHPEYQIAKDAKTAEIEENKGAAIDAVTPEVLNTLQAHKLGAEATNDGFVKITGETYDWKDSIKAIQGRRWDDVEKAWKLPVAGFNEFVRKLAGLPRPDAKRQGAGVPKYLRDERLGTVRKNADARPDRSGFTDAIGNHIGDDTKALVSRGLKIGMPQFVVDEQVEDVARINRAFKDGKKLFILASEPGSGKTFVLGGAIREMKKAGAKNIVYVTLRKELISQIQHDLADFGIDDVKFITYPEMRKAPPAESDVLIFDEAHAIKNVKDAEEGGAQQAKKAAEWISKAKFTILSSATPFENPVQAMYLEPTGIFSEAFGDAKTFAEAYGASSRTFKVRTKYGEIEKTELYWKRTTTSDVDSKAVREFFRKEGVFTSRKIRLPAGSADSRMVSITVSEAAAKVYKGFDEAAEEREDQLPKIAVMWVTNFKKRLLEAAKVQKGIEEADDAMKRGRWPILFVETKAERKFDIPEILAKEEEYKAACAIVAAQRQRGSDEQYPKRSDYGLPPEGIPEVLGEFMEKTGLKTIEIPSAMDIILKHFGEKNVAVFTGDVTPAKAQENLDRWRAAKKPMVILATMAKGGTGLSLHDKVGDHQTTQININLPWTATQVVQVAQRSARYGIKGKAEMQWIFADNIPFDRALSNRVGGRMADMGSVVHGAELEGASNIEDFNFEDKPFSEVNQEIRDENSGSSKKQGKLPFKGVEKIVAAAVKDAESGEVETASHHGYLEGIDDSEKEAGFYTSHNRFVSRREAYKIAKNAGQLVKGGGWSDSTGVLHSEDVVNMPLTDNRKFLESRVSPPAQDEIHGPLSARETQSYLYRNYGLQPNSMAVLLLRDSSDKGDWAGRAVFDKPGGRFLRIEYNMDKITSAEQLKWTTEHEVAHVAVEDGSMQQALALVTREEMSGIMQDIADADYKPSEYYDEQNARGLQALVQSWRGRNWFEKAVGAVTYIASKVGLKLNRLSAEQAAVVAWSRALDKVKSQRPEFTAREKQIQEAGRFEDVSQPGTKTSYAKTPEAGGEPERIPTQIAGVETHVLGRDQLTKEDRNASDAYAVRVMSGFKLPGSADPFYGFKIQGDGFNYDAEGEMLLARLTKDIVEKDRPGNSWVNSTGIINALKLNFNAGNLDDVFSPEMKYKLMSVAQGESSRRGIELAALKGSPEDLRGVARNADFYLRRTYDDAFGGPEVKNLIERIFLNFRDHFTDKEIDDARRSFPALDETFNRITALNREDIGGRVYRRVQNLLKPKQAKKLSKLEADAKAEEAVNEILEQAKKQGMVPVERPGKKSLSPLEKLLHLVTPANAEKIDVLISQAVADAERNAGMKAALNRAGKDGKDAIAELQARFDAGEEPTPEDIESGFTLPEYAHWKAIRDNLAGYSPTTLKLAQEVLKGSFKGLKFEGGKQRPEDVRIDINKLAKEPDAEIRRVAEDYVGRIENFIAPADASDETRLRVVQMIYSELTEQVAAARRRMVDILVAEKAKKQPGNNLTPEQKIAQLLNAGLFKDERLSDSAIVDKIAGSTTISRLVPNIRDLVKQVLETPEAKQGDLRGAFIERLKASMNVSDEQAGKLWDVFGKAFDEKLKLARSRAVDEAIQQLTPKEREIVQKKTQFERIRKAVNAGVFSDRKIVEDLARENGWKPPTPERLAALRELSNEEERLRTLDPAMVAKIKATTPAAEVETVLKREREKLEAATLFARSGIMRQMATEWSSMTKPITVPGMNAPILAADSWRNFWKTANRKNVAATMNERGTLNLLLKAGFAVRLPIHILTQTVGHGITRPTAYAIKSARNRDEFFKDLATNYSDSLKAQIAAIKPAMVSARAEILGRGETRNAQRLLSGVNGMERTAAQISEYMAKGEHAKAAIAYLYNLPRYVGWFVSAVDHWQGKPVEYQEIMLQIGRAARENGWSSAQIEAFGENIFKAMSAEQAAAVSYVSGVHEAMGLKTNQRQIEEEATNVVRRNIYNMIEAAGLPADDFEARNNVLRNAVSWQERTVRGVGGVLNKALQSVSSSLEDYGIPFASGRLSNAIGTGINYSLMWTPFYKLAEFGSKDDPASGWFAQDVDRTQRMLQAVVGTMVGASLIAAVMSGAIRVNLWPPQDKRKREEFYAEGHRGGTVEFLNDDGSFVPVSLTVGPMSLVAPYLTAGQAVRDLIDGRARKQAALDAKNDALGLARTPIEALGAGDVMGVALKGAYGTIMGGHAAGGFAQTMSEQGVPNLAKIESSQITPFAPLPVAGYQEFTRAMGIQLDSKMATAWDFLVPLPTSAARQVNVLGDPVKTPDDIQRIIQVATAGTYPGVVSPGESVQQAGDANAYAALYTSGFRPPTINAGKGYVFGGSYRPMTATELQEYTVARGLNLKAGLAGLGPNASLAEVKSAYDAANAQALQSAGVSVLPAVRAAKLPEAAPASQPERPVAQKPQPIRRARSGSLRFRAGSSSRRVGSHLRLRSKKARRPSVRSALRKPRALKISSKRSSLKFRKRKSVFET
jgi:DNA-binding protein YbaB